MISPEGRMELLYDLARRSVTKVRNKLYVDGTNGNDNYDGLSPEQKKATIASAIAAAAQGDLIFVAEDAYDEALDLNLTGLELICEPGTLLNNTTPGTVLTVSANYVRVKGAIISQAGQVGLHVTGHYFEGEDILVVGCTTSFDMDGDSPLMKNCRSEAHTVTGFDIDDDHGIYRHCFAVGTAATRGFHFSHTNAEYNVLLDCHSLNNTAAGYELVAGADNNHFAFCSQSSLCGGPIDAGANNTFAQFIEESQITAGNSLQDDLAIIEAFVDELEGRLTAARAGYLDEVTIRKIQSGSKAINAAITKYLHIDSGTNGAEILSIAIEGVIAHAWTLDVYVPAADGEAVTQAKSKRDTKAYLAAGAEGGLLKPFAIPFDCCLDFTNDGANDQIDQVTITYRSAAALSLAWEA